jgi:hypothetical protein
VGDFLAARCTAPILTAVNASDRDGELATLVVAPVKLSEDEALIEGLHIAGAVISTDGTSDVRMRLLQALPRLSRASPETSFKLSPQSCCGLPTLLWHTLSPL